MSITGAYTWEDISSLGMEAYFQPIYNVEKHRITGLEALFRARDGKGGFLDPESLVQEAEEGGWVHEIDLWMIRECCRWFTRFAEHGITRINVNLSPQTWWRLSGRRSAAAWTGTASSMGRSGWR